MKYYITPTIKEVEQIAEAGADLIAIDATKLYRPGGVTLEQLISGIRERFPNLQIVADVSTFDEGEYVMEMGVDLVSTTMSGYTSHSKRQIGPDIELVERLAGLGSVPVLSEGRIWNIEQCRRCLEAGAYAVVIGTAITRPKDMTKRFVSAIQNQYNSAS